LHPTLGIWRETLRDIGSASGAFCCRGGLYEGCADSRFKAGDRGDEEALCLLDLHLLEGAVFKVPLDKEFFCKGGSPFVFDAARGASCKDKADACVFTTGVAASKILSCGEIFAFEVGFPFVHLPSSG